jgi:hypothetical protein
MAKNTIKLKKYVDIINEVEASGVITPGMLLETDSDGKVKAHSSAGGNAVKQFALEDALQGNGIDDDYASGDKVQVWSCVPGEEVYALLKDGENVGIGDFLESAGAGMLQKHVTGSAGEVEYPAGIVAMVLEALDLSGSSGEEPTNRVKIRIV